MARAERIKVYGVRKGVKWRSRDKSLQDIVLGRKWFKVFIMPFGIHVLCIFWNDGRMCFAGTMVESRKMEIKGVEGCRIFLFQLTEICQKQSPMPYWIFSVNPNVSLP